MERKHISINSAILDPMRFCCIAAGGHGKASANTSKIPRKWVDDRSLVQTSGEQRKRTRFEPVRTYFALNAPLRKVRREFGL